MFVENLDRSTRITAASIIPSYCSSFIKMLLDWIMVLFISVDPHPLAVTLTDVIGTSGKHAGRMASVKVTLRSSLNNPMSSYKNGF